jgi:hypothetical protein
MERIECLSRELPPDDREKLLEIVGKVNQIIHVLNALVEALHKIAEGAKQNG